MIRTDMVHETSVTLHHLTWRLAGEDFIELVAMKPSKNKIITFSNHHVLWFVLGQNQTLKLRRILF